jgi:predicted Zn-dependent peptidase
MRIRGIKPVSPPDSAKHVFANAKLRRNGGKTELEFLNARIEIHVTSDSTVFQAQTPASNVEAVLALFARLIVQPIYIQEGVDRIKCELRSAQLSLPEPQAMARLHLGELVFGQTGCARVEWGTRNRSMLCASQISKPSVKPTICPTTQP